MATCRGVGPELTMPFDSDRASHDETLPYLLGDLARLGISIASENGETSFRVPPDAVIPAELLAIARARIDALATPSCLPSCHNECLVPLTARPGDANLICVHPAHSTAYDYRFVAAEMPQRYAVYGLQAVRLLIGGRAVKTPEEMAGRYVDEILSNGLCDKPMVLYGASSGGALVLDVARRLAARGHVPCLTVAGDTRDPIEMSESTAQVLRSRLLWLGFIEAFGPPGAVSEVAPGTHPFWSLSDAGRLAYFLTQVQALPSPTCSLPLVEDVLRRHLVTYGEYLNCYENWSPGGYLGRSVYLIAARSQPQRSTRFRSLLLGPHAVREVAGDHISMLRETGAAAVAAAIDAEVRAAMELRALPAVPNLG